MARLTPALVGLDASRAGRDVVTGTEAYSRHLITALLRRPSDLRYRLYASRPTGALFAPSPRFEERIIRMPYLWTHLGLRSELVRSRPDLLFVPSHVIPVGCPVRSVVTIHDVGYLWHRSAYSPLAWLLLDLGTRYNARVARWIIADSQATARDLTAHFRVRPERTRVAYLGAPPVQDVPRDPLLLSRYGLQDPYYLFVGTLHPRKNLERVLRAFARIVRRPARPVLLALAGAAGHGSATLIAWIRRLRIEDRVRLLGYVPAADLAGLYAGAVGFVFPSLYEGFGLPALEAMAWGAPVLSSTTSSLPEVVGDAGLLVDPYDVAGLADAMELLLEDADLRERLIAAGRARAPQFSWDRCAEETEAVLHDALA